MKNSKKFFVCVLCILLSVVIACGTLMAGAADAVLEETTASLTEITSIYYPPLYTTTTTTEKDITDTISEFVSENELQDDLNNIGNDIKEATSKTSGFLQDIIDAIQKLSDNISKFLKKIFNLDFFN